MRTRVYRRYVLGVLTLVYTLNFLDQGLIGLLLQPIKQDLQLSDSQLGFLTGIAFAFFYATLGVPIARWADRGNRVTITAAAIALWGVTVMSSLLVRNFLQLVIARIAAGIGESGCMPPTYSLVGDYFPKPAERARAMAIYWLAGPLAALISYVAGGWLNELVGWRWTFYIMGLPALVVAVIVKLTVAEPRIATRSTTSVPTLPSKRAVLSTLWHQRSTRHLICALILIYVIGAGLSPWYAAFMMRSHGMGTAQLGVWLGLIFGLSGLVGIGLGGYVAGRWFASNDAGQMRLSAVLVALTTPFFALFLVLPSKGWALACLVPLSIMFAFFAGPAFALMQRLVADDARATTLAVTMLLANLIGMGAGPQLVGIISDAMLPRWGGDSLRYAMLMMSFAAIWAAYHLWQVSRAVSEDLAARECSIGQPGSSLVAIGVAPAQTSN